MRHWGANKTILMSWQICSSSVLAPFQESTSIYSVAHFRNRDLLSPFPILYPSPYISLLYCANCTHKIPLKIVHIGPNHSPPLQSRSATSLTRTSAEVCPIPLSSTSQPFSAQSEMFPKDRSDRATVLLQILQLHLRQNPKQLTAL